jgi:nitroreductase family protein
MPESELRRAAVIRYEDLNLSAEALEATRHRLVRTVPKRPGNPYQRSYDVGQAIIERYSARMFSPEPVRRGFVDEALRLGRHAPSSCNIQPWRLFFVSEAARNRLKDALLKVPDQEALHIPYSRANGYSRKNAGCGREPPISDRSQRELRSRFPTESKKADRKRSVPWPEAFEAASLAYLNKKLGIQL